MDAPQAAPPPGVVTEDFYTTALRALDDWHQANRPHDLELLVAGARQLDRTRRIGNWLAELLRQQLDDMTPEDRAAVHTALDQWREVTR